MALESAVYISNLVSTNPTPGDPKAQGDDHLRLVKAALQNTFPGFTGAVIAGGTSTGVANAYLLSAVLTSYVANTVVVWTPAASNSGTSTININGLGIVNIKRIDGNILQLNDLVLGQYVAMVYTGSEFRLVNVTKSYIDNMSFSSSLPSMTGNGGKVITTDGSTATWSNTLSLSTLALSTALPVTSGGTGGTTAGAARTGILAAASGANTDISSLTGMTTPLAVIYGGSGVSTATGSGNNVLSQSPALTGAPTAPTPSAVDNSTTLATTAFVQTSFAPLSSPALTGTPTAPTAIASTNTTQVATTAMVHSITDNITGMRNRIINGACNIVQRGTSQAFALNTYGYGGPDRFFCQSMNNGSTLTQSQSSLTYTSVVKNTVRQTINTIATNLTGTNFIVGIAQIIEGFNVYDLLGQTITISFIFNTNVAGTYSIALRDGPLVNSYVTTFTVAANTPTRITKTIAVPTTISIPNSNASGLSLYIGALNTGTFQTSTLDTWQAAVIFAANTQTNWAATIGNFIELTELQLEKGSIATPFENRSYGMELALCQRYYQKSYDYAVIAGSNSMNGIEGGVSINAVDTYDWGVRIFRNGRMRLSPSMIIYNPGTGGNSIRDISNGVDRVAVLSIVSESGYRINSTNMAAVAAVVWHYTASAEL